MRGWPRRSPAGSGAWAPASCYGGGRFVLETISGELPDELAAVAEERGGRLWLPFTAEVADG